MGKEMQKFAGTPALLGGSFLLSFSHNVLLQIGIG
jgi:hypothetical protein